MNIFICFLLLFIWKTSCLNKNQSDGSSTTGSKHLESMKAILETVKDILLMVIIGFMIIAFCCGCCWCFHYKCGGNEARTVGNESVSARSSRSYKISFRKFNRVSPCVLEEESMLFGTHNLSGPSNEGMSSIPCSRESLLRHPSSETSSIQSNAEKLMRPSSQQQSSKPSSSKIVFNSFCLKEPRRTCSLNNLEELVDSYKLLSQGSFSYPNIVLRSPCRARLQYSVRTTQARCPPRPQNQNKSSGHSNVKQSVAKGMVNLVSGPQLVMPCPCEQEKFFVSKTTPESLANGTCEPRETNAQNLSFPHEVTRDSISFHEVDDKDNALYDNVSEQDKMTNDTDAVSDEKMTTVCNENLNDVIPKDTSTN